MTVDQVAAYLQMNRLTVYRYVREGKIPAAKFGKLYRILKSDVDHFLEMRKAPVRVTDAQTPAASRRGRSVWVKDGKAAHEIYVGPSRRDRAQDLDPVILGGDPLALIIRSLN
jgi:excisionase family DNA binding protein